MEKKETKVSEPETNVKKEDEVVEPPSDAGVPGAPAAPVAPVVPGAEDDPTGAGSESTMSSGIGTGKSSENNSDNLSVSSGGTGQAVPTPTGKVLSLCQKGDWMVLDQHLRVIQRAHPDLSQQDEVRHNVF